MLSPSNQVRVAKLESGLADNQVHLIKREASWAKELLTINNRLDK